MMGFLIFSRSYSSETCTKRLLVMIVSELWKYFHKDTFFVKHSEFSSSKQSIKVGTKNLHAEWTFVLMVVFF